jgi:hypothetical protein
MGSGQQSHFRLFPVLAGLLVTGVATVLIALARPQCDDSTLKAVLIHCAFLGQWLLVATFVGYTARINPILHGLAFGVSGALLSGVVWLLMLWGWRAFTWRFYWWVTWPPAVLIVPLCVLAAWFGSRQYRPLADRTGV